jgi:AcrR family transcriptional regulator
MLQTDRTASTRAALVSAARALFAEHGFAAVGTERIVRAAGVSRGALYHHFTDKTELFAAVLEAVEADILREVNATISATSKDPIDGMIAGTDAWLDACAEPEVQRIVLLDAPAVLGWERWREVELRHSLGLVENLLSQAMAVGRIRRRPLRPLAHIVIGALDEAALYTACADDPETARRDVRVVLREVFLALASDADSPRTTS